MRQVWPQSNAPCLPLGTNTDKTRLTAQNSEILSPIQKYGITKEGPGALAFKKLKVNFDLDFADFQILLDRMMLRRTKLERADDLGLPPRTIVVRKDFFSPAEKELYMSLFTDSKRQFSTFVSAGTVLNSTLHFWVAAVADMQTTPTSFHSSREVGCW